MERAHQLLKANGLVSYIVSNTWLPSLSFQKIRRFLTSVFTWRSLLVVRTKVFAAVVDTNVFLFEKSKPAANGTLPVDFYTDDGVQHAHRLPWAQIPKTGDAINVVFDPKAQTLFRKMSGTSWLLKVNTDVYNGVKPFEKGKGTPPQTAETMRDKPFVAVDCSKPAGRNWMPLLRGSLIHRYVTFWNNDSWIQYGSWLAAPRAPSIYSFINPEKGEALAQVKKITLRNFRFPTRQLRSRNQSLRPSKRSLPPSKRTPPPTRAPWSARSTSRFTPSTA